MPPGVVVAPRSGVMRRAGASGAPALRVTPVRHGRRGADELTLTARVENVLDQHYELASGYNTMGRSLFASMRYSLR